MEHETKILVIGVMLTAIIIGVIIIGNAVFGYSHYNFAEPKVDGMDIYYDVVCTQGAAENLPGMERVNVHGTVSNTGDEELKNITVTVVFTDAAHDRIVRQTVAEGVDLLPDGVVSIEFDAEYLRELTMPKTVVDGTIQVNWTEDGELKTFTTR